MSAVNMAQFIAPKSDQLNSDDLIGGPLTVRINHVSANEGQPEQPINVFYDGDNGKPFRPCKSMRRVMVAIWGPDASQYVGRAMTLYRDPEVQFGGMKVGGIRISHMSHIDKPQTMALTATRANRKPFTVQPLKIEEPAPAKAKQTPEEWAEQQAKATLACDTPEALAALIVKGSKAMDKLAIDYPDLHKKVEAAYEVRSCEVAPAPAAEPAE